MSQARAGGRTPGTMENVWDYPRPPALEPCTRRVRVEHAGIVVADSGTALRVLETSHPPGIYIPLQDVAVALLRPSGGRGSFCEWKGRAAYFDLATGTEVVERAAWTYRHPVPSYAAIKDHVAFYPSRVDRCLLGDEVVEAQEGDFYGGWITSDIAGPFKGAAGTAGW